MAHGAMASDHRTRRKGSAFWGLRSKPATTGLRQGNQRYTTLLVAELLLILIYPFVSAVACATWSSVWPPLCFFRRRSMQYWARDA